MRKIIYILVFLLSILVYKLLTNDSNYINDVPQYKKLCIVNSVDSRESCISSSNDANTDVFEMLCKIGLYHLIPDNGKYKGKIQLITTDTLGGGILPSQVKGFVMSDAYFNHYEYNEIGLIKRFLYIDDVKAEDCIEVNYRYKERELIEILAVNPHLSSYDEEEKKGNNSFLFRPDTLYKVKLTYNTESLLKTIITIENNKKILYNASYKK